MLEFLKALRFEGAGASCVLVRGASRCILVFGILWLGILLLAASGVQAQTNEEINAGLQFSFTPPGARSLGMGGAFSGLADDATAAYANPAGLIWISRSEVSIEGRYRNYTTRYPYSGSASFSPTGNGIDTRPDLEFRDFDSDVSGLSFLSYAHVFGDRWRVAIYRHELAAFRADLESEGPFIRNGGDGTPAEQSRLRSRLSPLRGDLSLDIVNLGLSVAYRAHETLWLGLGVSRYAFDYRARTTRFEVNSDFRFGGLSRVSFDPADFSPANETEKSFQDGDDDDLAVIAGLIYKARSNKWGLGLVYRQAPEFDLDYRYEWGARRFARRDETGNENYVDPGVVRALTGTTEFGVPEMISLGFMWKPTQSLTLSFEYARIDYSALEPEANLISSALRGSPVPGTSQDLSVDSCGEYTLDGRRYPIDTDPRTEVPCIANAVGVNFKVEDGDEFHLGLEYVLPRARPIALRFGVWHDPDHQLTYDFGDRTPEEVGGPVDRFAFRFAPGQDEWHVAGGLGIVFGQVQFDIAADVSERAEILSFSSVYRF